MTVFEFLSVLTGFIAIVLTVIMAFQNYEHNRKSVKPKLVIRSHLAGSKGYFGISVKNDGLGPAIITGFEIQAIDLETNDEESNFWDLVAEKYNLFDARLRYESIFPDGVIPSGERVWLLSTDINDDYKERLEHAINEINISIFYKSMYSQQDAAYFNKRSEM